ncbi:MAG TPA: hypothetical protein VKO45_07000 [Methanomicrobiales archaeon]|nr:hypothetical protein [Methanomicrobiales archaeon]
MAPALEPSALGIFVFGLIAGICPCNNAVCLGLIGYLSVRKDRVPPLRVLERRERANPAPSKPGMRASSLSQRTGSTTVPAGSSP